VILVSDKILELVAKKIAKSDFAKHLKSRSREINTGILRQAQGPPFDFAQGPSGARFLEIEIKGTRHEDTANRSFLCK